MNIDDFRRAEMSAVSHCAARSYCPLSALCGTAAEEKAPLFPTVTEIAQGDVVWVDLRFEQRVCVIQTGLFSCTANLEHEHEVPFAVYGSGYAIGVNELYIERAITNSYYLRALTPGRICSFSAKILRRHLENAAAPQLGSVLSCALTNLSAATFTQLKIVSRTPLQDRIGMFLLYLRALAAREGRVLEEVNLTHGDIAALTLSDRISVTRTLHRMEEAGLVAPGYRSVRLLEGLLARDDLKRDVQTAFHIPKTPQRPAP